MEREGLTSRKQSSELQGVPTTQVSLQGLGTSKTLYKNENCVGGGRRRSTLGQFTFREYLEY